MAYAQFLELYGSIVHHVKKPNWVSRVFQVKTLETLSKTKLKEAGLVVHMSNVGTIISPSCSIGYRPIQFSASNSLKSYSFGHLGTPCNPNLRVFTTVGNGTRFINGCDWRASSSVWNCGFLSKGGKCRVFSSQCNFGSFTNRGNWRGFSILSNFGFFTSRGNCRGFSSLSNFGFFTNKGNCVGDSRFLANWVDLRVFTNRVYRGFSTDGGNSDWTDDVVYLDECGDIITSSKGTRSVKPGEDDHIMIGGVKRTLSDSEIVGKIIEIMRRWTWGPEMELQLDRLHFCLKMSHINHALRSLKEVDVALGLFNWAKMQSWYSPNDQTYDILLGGLIKEGDFDGVQSLLENMRKEGSAVPSRAYKRVIQYYTASGKLELAFSCFKQMEDAGCHVDTETYNSLIVSFLNMGLPYKGFEIYEAMEKAGCSPDAATFEMMIPNLAKSGRLDTAIKLYDDMKSQGLRPNALIFSSLVDSLGKAGRLDMTMKVYMDMQAAAFRPSASTFVSLVESYVKAGKLEMALRVWDEMKQAGFRPNYALYTMVVEAHAKAGKLDTAMSVFSNMEKAGFLPMASTFSILVDMHSARGQVDQAMKLYNSMNNAGLRPTLSTYTSLLTALANKKMLDTSAKILMDMKAIGFTVDVNASDILMIFIKEGSVDLALRWLRFMSSAGIKTNNFIIRQLFESCMRSGLYESAKPLLETYVSSAAKVDMVLYTSILAHLVRCQDEQSERLLMSILSSTKHKAHAFICGLFSGPEQRKEPVLSFVRAFFQGIDFESEESAARYFVNVLLNYLVLMGQINRARCVWKVAYENKLFPKAIVFDEHIAWSLDVRHLSVGAGLIASIHTLHRFRKRMLYYGVIPRRIKIVTGTTLKIVIAHILSTVNSPFEVNKVVLRATGESVLEWFKKPIVQQFLLNEIPSRSDILMHRLNTLFPCSSPEMRSSSSFRTTSLRN